MFTHSADRWSVAGVSALTLGRIWLIVAEADLHLVWFGSVLVGMAFLWIVKHNAIHLPLFTRPGLNTAFGLLLSVNSGSSVTNTALVHNEIHHRHDNGPSDWTTLALVSRFQSPVARMALYPFLVIRSIHRNRPRYLRTRPTLRRRIAKENTFVAVGVLTGAVISPWSALWYLGVPMVVGQFLLVFVNYLEHVNCKPGEANDVNNRWLNRLAQNVGHHNRHHQRPSAHWTELAQPVEEGVRARSGPANRK